MASSRTALRARVARPRRDVLAADGPRTAGPTSALSIDGRELSLRVGDRLTGCVLERSIEGANTLSIELWDQDRRVLTSGVLGRRVMTRAAEVTLDGLTYSVAGLSRSGDTLSVTCEDATITVLKRHRPKHPLNVSRGRMTRAQAAATAVRRAGVPVVVLDEQVVQPVKGARKLRDELKAAKRDTSAEASKGRSGTIKVNAAGLEFSGRPASKAQRRNVGLAMDAAQETRAGPKATLALFMACIVEPAGYQGSGPFDNPAGGDRTSEGILQLLSTTASGLGVSARDVKAVARLFLTKGFWGKGGAIKIARENPEMSAGMVAQNVQGSAVPARYDAVRDQALAAIKAASGTSGQPGGSDDADAYVERYAFVQRRGESTYGFVRRLMDEVTWRVFIREGVVVIASEPALARAVPALVLDETLLEQDDFEQHRALRAGEASLQAYVGAYDADPGETVLIDTLPQLDDANWLIASSRVDLLDDVPLVDISVRLPQKPSPEPASTVKTRPGDDSGAGDSSTGSSGSTRDRIVAAAKSTLTSRTRFSRYSLTGPLTTDPTPPAPARTDCSQWARAVYLKAGAPDPGTNTIAMMQRGRETSRPKPGDIMVSASHCEIYIGGDELIGHGSPPIDPGSVAYWRPRGMKFRTYLDD